MRIALVSYDDSPPQGGQGVVVRDMRAALLASGVDVVTVSGRGDHAVAYPRRLGRPPLDFSLHLARHPELITQLGADIVHLLGGPGGVLFTRRLSVPMVVTANHTYRQAHRRSSPRRGLALVEARTYRRAARVMAVSASTATAVAAMGIPRDRIEVLAPGVQIPELGSANVRDPQRLLFVGRLESEKGVLDAVAVMAELAARTPGVHGRVVGRGRLKAVVAAACAASSGVEFVGAVSDQQLAAEYASAAVVLVPSAYEGLGLVALEAMAAGAAVCQSPCSARPPAR